MKLLDQKYKRVYKIHYGRDAGLDVEITRILPILRKPDGELDWLPTGLIIKWSILKSRGTTRIAGILTQTQYNFRASGPAIINYEIDGLKAKIRGISFAFEAQHTPTRQNTYGRDKLKKLFGINTLLHAPWFESSVDHMMWLNLIDRGQD